MATLTTAGRSAGLRRSPDTSNALFTGSGKCAGCHGTDPVAYANVTADGADINPTSQWRSSLMANSAKDPFWRAKVAHEVAVNPDHQLELEDKCTSCHAPLGHFNAHHLEKSPLFHGPALPGQLWHWTV